MQQVKKKKKKRALFMQQVKKKKKQEKSKGEKNSAHNIEKKRSSRPPLHAITLDVLSTKQHEHFLRLFNMTGTTGRSVCFVLRRHDSVIELAISPQADLH